MRPIKLHVYDFDGTLFKSPEPPIWWKEGAEWWGDLNSLSTPCVPEEPTIDWWNESVVERAKQSLENVEVRTILLTGRVQKFSLRIRQLLRQAGLDFQEIYLSPGDTDTERFKLETIKKILSKQPSIRGVAIWEDRLGHLRTFADWIESNGRSCVPHLVTVARHDVDCPPPLSARLASAVVVAARYKSKTKDDEGNVHYEYSDRQVANRHSEKAERIERLRKDLSDLRKMIKKDISSKDPKVALPALAAALMDETCERVGNEGSAEEGHYGVTGWRKKHISFSGSKATLKYVGKSGVKHEKVVESAPVVKLLKELAEGKKGDDCLLSRDDYTVKPEAVNDYLSEFDITAKDIRGLRANQEMCKALREQRKEGPDLPRARKERDKILKKEFADALEEVADIVGHEKATLRSDYLVPGLEDAFMKDGTILSSFKESKSATKTEAEKEDEATEALLKPEPKKKPPRKDLQNHRVDSGDKDLDATDDDLSLNYKKVALRVAMAYFMTAPSRVASRYLLALDSEEDDEFLESVEGKTFHNKETNKDVKFQSLPDEEQKRIRAEWAEKAKEFEEEGSKEDKLRKKKREQEEARKRDLKGLPPKPPKPEPKPESGEAPPDPKKQQEDADAEEEAQYKRDEAEELDKRRRSEIHQKAQSVKDSPAFSKEDSRFVKSTLDSLTEQMTTEDAEKFVEKLTADRDEAIGRMAAGNSPSTKKPPSPEKIEKLKSKYEDLNDEIEGLKRSFAKTQGDRILQLTEKRDQVEKELQSSFSKFFVHAATAEAARNPMTYIGDTSSPIDKAGVKERTSKTVERFDGMSPDDRAETKKTFARVRTDTQDKISDLEEKLSSNSGAPQSPEEREADQKELEQLRNRMGYLAADHRALELSSALEGDDDSESSIPTGTRTMLRSLKESGVDVSDMIEAGLGVPGSEPSAEVVSDMVRKLQPEQMEKALEAVDPSGKLAASWRKIYDGEDSEDEADYVWPFSGLKASQRERVRNAHDVFTELLTNVAVEDAASEREPLTEMRREKAPSRSKPTDFSGPGDSSESEEKAPYESQVQDAIGDLVDLDIDTGSSNKTSSLEWNW